MKPAASLFLGLALLSGPSAFAQRSPMPPVVAPLPAGELTPAQPLQRFDLDFAGGTPEELVASIEKGLGHPFNHVVPETQKGQGLPALRFRNVDLVQVFTALSRATQSTLATTKGQYFNTSYTFITDGRPSENSVWVFFNDVPQDVKVCRFFLLTPYLGHGATVNDITTAIQTGWKMLGSSTTPALSYHEETKLLIAVGSANQMETIEQVLQALKSASTPSS